MKERIELPVNLLGHIPWENPVNPIWPATTFVLHRNLNKFYFPPKMNDVQMQQTSSILADLLCKHSKLRSPQFLPADLLTPLDKEFLFEHFLCEQGFQNTMSGQGFIIDDSARFLALLNIDDHLQLHFADCKNDWDIAWNTLSEVEMSIGQSATYAFSSRFGYLTSDLNNCGTGLEIFAYLHVPALIHANQLTDTLLKQKEEDVIATGLQGTLEDIVGDFIVLKNRYSIGVSEETILRTTYSTAMHLMAAEKNLRTRIQQEDNPDFKDHISRAFGLLMHSFQLQTKEALNALSMIKLGIDLKWILGITDNKMNELFFRCRRAHLEKSQKHIELDPQKLSHIRAEYLHKELQSTKLTYE